MSVNNTLLNIISWNAQSISNGSKTAELERLLRERDIHIVCLQETYLNHNTKLYMPNYTIYRNDRTTHGGGVAILVKKGIQHELLRLCATVSIENIAIAVTFHNKRIIITSAYSPHYNNSFSNDLTAITSAPGECLIFGDLNAKHTAWRCTTNNAAGNSLLIHLNNSDFSLHAPGTHTHFPHAGSTPSTIDLLLANTVSPINSFCTLDNFLVSDHCPIFCQLDCAFSTLSKPSFQYERADWTAYQQFFGDNLLTASCDTPVEIEESISRFSNIITASREAAIPTVVYRDRTTRLASDTICAIRYKNKLTRNWQRCMDPVNKGILKSAINIAGKLVKDLVRRDRNSNWRSMLEQLGPGSKKFWRISRSLRGKRVSAPGTLRHGNDIIITSLDRAEAFASVFEKSHTTTLNDVHPHDRIVHRAMNGMNRTDTNDEFDAFTVADLTEEIATLRPFKAPGGDNIPNILLKYLPEIALGELCDIYNACLRLNHWPTSFKLAKVTPIPKPGKDKGCSENYRPISLLNTLGKLFEKLIHKRISVFVAENDILNAEQFGFRPQHSTSHQVLRVVNHVRNNRAQRKSTGMVLFDIEKAFDSVWHDGLIFKLHKRGFPRYLCRMIREFTADRFFEVHVFDAKSGPRPIPAGLPQGSILSPILYSIYVSDLKLNRHSNSACYADDTAIYASANRTKTICTRLQGTLRRVEKFCNKWKIKINPTKTQAVFFPFNNQRRRRPTTNLTLNDVPIEFSASVTYLGVVLDSKLNFRTHVDQIRGRASRCMSALYPLIGRRSTLSADNKLRIFKMIIRPILTYASPVWIRAAISNRKHLQIIQNKCLKSILKLPWRFPTIDLHERAGVLTLFEYIGNLNLNFNEKCATSDFRLIRELAL